MSNLDLYFDVAAVGMSDCLEMGRRMVFKNYLEGKKLTLISNSGSGLEYTIHTCVRLHLNKCLSNIDRPLYSGFLVNDKVCKSNTSVTTMNAGSMLFLFPLEVQVKMV